MNTRIQILNIQRNWTPPDGLDRSRPRPVTLTRGGKALLHLAIALVVAAVSVGINLTLLAIRQAEEVRLLREEGVEIDARVTRLWRARGENKQPWIDYGFTIEGRSYERQAKAPLQIWKTLQIGADLPVLYLPSDPEINYPRGFSKNVLPIWLPIVVSAVLTAAGLFAMRALIGRRRLAALGRPAPGLVMQHLAMERSSHGREIGRKYRYEFPLLSGAIAKGVSGPSKTPPAVGSIICVLYDPENPRKNAPYPLPLVRPPDSRGR